MNSLHAPPRTSDLRRWKRWLDRIYDFQIEPLASRLAVFQVFQAVTKELRADKRSTAHLVGNWIAGNFAVFATSWIRKSAEKSKRRKGRTLSYSLRELLEDIQRSPGQLSFPFLAQRLAKSSTAMKFARHQWERAVGRSRTISPKFVERDIARLEQTTRRIKAIVDRQVAHTDKTPGPLMATSFGEIRRAIEVVVNVWLRYRYIVVGTVPTPLSPKFDEDLVRKAFLTMWRVAASDHPGPNDGVQTGPGGTT